ncbi:MAG: hypothetical protein P1V51_08890 [Deltaproteobacteria bacterium]|nr:hypothetical protein [Deltaproteobacteria bacterium]
MAGVSSTTIKARGRQVRNESEHRGRVLFVGPHEEPGMAEALESKGFQIICTSSVVQALTLAVAARITLVVTGPGEVGESFLDALRSLPGRKDKRDLPLIWLGEGGEDEEQLLRRGVSLYLKAPYPLEHLVTVASFAA